MTQPRIPTEEIFLKEVAHHQMAIIRDDGNNRHLRFRQPNTNCFMFEIVTWPGYLCFCGDMGTYVFSRIDDMFEFFRTDRHMPLTDGKTLAINPSYWGEKLQAESTFGEGFEKFSMDRLREIVKREFDEYIESKELPEDKAVALWESLESEVLSMDNDNEYAAYLALRDFEHDGFEFTDASEFDLNAYTWHFIWCCYALAWAVQQYDNSKRAAGTDNRKE